MLAVAAVQAADAKQLDLPEGGTTTISTAGGGNPITQRSQTMYSKRARSRRLANSPSQSRKSSNGYKNWTVEGQEHRYQT